MEVTHAEPVANTGDLALQKSCSPRLASTQQDTKVHPIAYQDAMSLESFSSVNDQAKADSKVSKNKNENKRTSKSCDIRSSNANNSYNSDVVVADTKLSQSLNKSLETKGAKR